MTTTDVQDIVQRLLADKPSFHLSGQARWDCLPETLEEVRRSASISESTMEIGVGVSTVVFAACGTNHTAVSPDPDEHERVRDYCRQIGVDDSKITFVVGFSDDVLPSLLSRERTLDMAFIDGAHSFPLPVLDWYYISRSLKIGGRLLLDDIPIPAVAQVFRHMAVEPNWHLDGIYDARAAAFTMVAEPEQEDDWLHQPFNKGYPDFSFASLPKRLRLVTGHRVRQARSHVGQRYPSARRIYRRIV